MSHHIIEVKDLQYTYPDGTPALRGVSFLLTHGETVALVGANGAGKSTLLLHLNGCLIPQAGMVRIGDFPLTRKTLPHVRRTVGMVFQDSDDQLFMPVVHDDVAFGPLNLGLPPEDVEERVRDALSIVGATHLRDRPPYRLSGGEKRSVAIASVLSMAPSILVMDDESIVRDVIAKQLTHLGYRAVLASNGVEALAVYQESLEMGRPFAAVIMDLTIPGGMGGVETIRRLLALDPRAKAIISSGYCNDPVMQNYKDYGFRGVVPKPYKLQDLKKTLENLLMQEN